MPEGDIEMKWDGYRVWWEETGEWDNGRNSAQWDVRGDMKGGMLPIIGAFNIYKCVTIFGTFPHRPYFILLISKPCHKFLVTNNISYVRESTFNL